MEQLGGCLIPLSAVIYAGHIFSLGSDVTNTSLRSGSAGKEAPSYVSHGPLLPFKTVMDFYFCGKPTNLSEVVNATQNQAKQGCPETTGFLCSSGNNIFKYEAVIVISLESALVLTNQEQTCYFVGELYLEQASSPVTSRTHQGYSALTGVLGYRLQLLMTALK